MPTVVNLEKNVSKNGMKVFLNVDDLWNSWKNIVIKSAEEGI